MSEQARAELAPTGVLRAGINLSNFLLVTGITPEGEPEGVSPDIARARIDQFETARDFQQGDTTLTSALNHLHDRLSDSAQQLSELLDDEASR